MVDEDATTAEENEVEKNFLQRHQERLVVQKEKQEQRRQTSNELNHFWSTLRAKLGEWNDRLDQLQQQNKANGVTAEQMHHEHKSQEQREENHIITTDKSSSTIRQDLIDLRQELYLLRGHCFSNTNDAAAIAYRDNQSKEFDIPDLPVSDWRLLHAEFSTHFERWETTKDSILPKGKFIFRRYREAMAKHVGRIASSDGNAVTKNETTSSKQALDTFKKTDQPILRDISNSEVHIHADGRITITASKESAATSSQQHSQSASKSVISIEVLNNCNVRISKQFQAVYVRNTIGCNFHLLASIQAALHVTNCKDVTVRNLSCQQIRLHESEGLRLQVSKLSSGAILESCKNIIFEVHEAIEIKDFHWLRTNVPSPNFQMTIIEQDDQVAKTETGIITDADTIPMVGSSSMVAERMTNTSSIDNIEHENTSQSGKHINDDLSSKLDGEVVYNSKEAGGTMDDDDDEL